MATQKDLDAIDDAISKGAKSVSYGDRTVVYRSMAEMKEARNMIVKKLKGKKRRMYVAYASKGL